jgi:hypothetical protein
MHVISMKSKGSYEYKSGLYWSICTRTGPWSKAFISLDASPACAEGLASCQRMCPALGVDQELWAFAVGIVHNKKRRVSEMGRDSV